ncbi:hypothetical protein ACGF5C_32585 [Micromonospora sp. NPDC047620]|uniref:hypothetical protein n=1 Tax=Micromonospora sp. NPDC047620 TaxID=3364251 RepID=UPI0037197021
MSENAQQREPDRVAGPSPRQEGATEPDVLLDVPKVSVDSIRLAVDGLDADLSLRARLANLLQIDAGVRVHMQGVELDITGVHAEAQLTVRLEKLADILDRALSTIDRNPQIIDALSRTATASIDDVNRATQQVANLGGQVAGSATQLGGQATGSAQQPGGQSRASAERPGGQVSGSGERPGGATDDLGQQVGAIGAVADRSLREPGTQGQGGGPGAGRATPGGGLAGAGEQGQRAGEQAGGEAGPSAQARPEQGGPEQVRRGQGGPGRGPREQPDEAGGDGTPSATQLAEQAGETLRQAGRSVWEAIQSGMAQRRQQGH